MIYDKIENIDLYSGLSDRMMEGIALLKKLIQNIPESVITEGENRLYATVRSYETAEPAEKKYESHRNLIDIQYTAKGREKVYIELYRDRYADLTDSPYDKEKDLQLYSIKPGPGNGNPGLLEPVNFMIIFPYDIHKPGCIIEDTAEPEKVLKVVVKVPLNDKDIFFRKTNLQEFTS